MDADDYLDAIARESNVLADAAARAGLDASVPSCPGWTVADLVDHVGNVQRWAARTVRTLTDARIDRDAMSEHPGPDALLEWFRAGAADLVDALHGADPGTVVWTFSRDRTVNFWFRRQAQEVAVHRWDAAGAASASPEPIDRALAVDGVDEWLALSAGGRTPRMTGDGETVHLHCTDLDGDGDGGDDDDHGAVPGEEHAGEWLVTLMPDGPRVETIHAKGDVAARGTASDLDLYVWGRVDADALEVFGDAALLERFRRSGMH